MPDALTSCRRPSTWSTGRRRLKSRRAPAQPSERHVSPMTSTARHLPNQQGFFDTALADSDPELFEAIRKEVGRQRDTIELIASENIVSQAVLEAQGSALTNKYAEGYPGRRYYGGFEFLDVAQQIALERARTLFAAALAHLHPHPRARHHHARCPGLP